MSVMISLVLRLDYVSKSRIRTLCVIKALLRIVERVYRRDPISAHPCRSCPIRTRYQYATLVLIQISYLLLKLLLG